ncbi:GAF and ANTAR domain-containing protein [Nocardioides yefusunii]|uniref:GAF and ANTAR domain-containing protein n=1 Tax=Nocardioides yefusunii TaxID=2500546 RepID=A0ABW1QRW1_9ACTN|nr:GAF and ANTAR domain-containing protein [Nocardioides yefusunii]
MAAWFAQISQELHAQPAEEPTLERILEQALNVVHGDWAGIALRRRRGRWESVAASAPVVTECDEIQAKLGDGPALAGEPDQVGLLCRNTLTDPRMPVWGPLAASKGVRSVLNLRLVLPRPDGDPRLLGAINIYDSRISAFTRDDLDRGLVFATHATRALATARELEGLEAAISSRHVIGIAQGILMQRYCLDQVNAFEALRRYASASNMKLRDVARTVIDNGALETPHVPAHREPDPLGSRPVLPKEELRP